MKIEKLSLIVPYYNQPEMLALQEGVWREYPPEVRVLLIDDGSQECPKPSHAKVYRILEDIPWNTPGAINLGARAAKDGWLCVMEIDHSLMPQEMRKLLAMDLERDAVYYFTREARHGQTQGQFLCERGWFWECGGMDEDFSGNYGYFEQQFASVVGRKITLPIHIECHNDMAGSAVGLPRDPEHNRNLYHKKAGTKAIQPFRYIWEEL